MNEFTQAPPCELPITAARGGALCDAVPDETLARAAAAGDRVAFEHLVTRHEGAVYRIAWRLLRNREDAEEAAQDAFVRAWRGLGGYDPSRDFRPWLMQIAVNAARTRLARRQATPAVDPDADPDAVPDQRASSAVSVVDAREKAALLDALIRVLPPASAEIFQLRYAENLSVDEVARATGRRPGAVAVALHRMREKFRAVLFGRHEGER